MDERDLALLKRGDETAFRRFFDGHSPRVYALATRLTDQDGAALEVTQEVFVQAWRGLPRFRGDASLDTWLHALTVRIARKYWRGEVRRRRREARYLDERGGAPHVASIELTAIDLQSALRELSPRVRAAVVLVCIEQRSYAEAAQLLGRAEGTVKAQVHHGRQLLRERLDR